ncbi:MAG: response regulator [Alphaproteobacteria bacterium]|nr:response regulator [Alphaproteobacteria bacterium]
MSTHNPRPHYSPVLFVDDDEITREIGRSYIESAGAECFVACNGQQAVEYLKSMFFSLVVTDIVMPEMDGLELMSWIKASGISVPVVALSGREIAHDLNCSKLATQLGADFGVCKPITATKIDIALMFRKSATGADWVEDCHVLPHQSSGQTNSINAQSLEAKSRPAPY